MSDVEAPVSQSSTTETTDQAELQDTQSQQQPADVAAADDPELEFEPGLKLRKSEAAKRLKQQKELERGAHEKFRESAKLRKEAEELIGGLTKDTKAALKRAGVDPVAFAEQVLSEALAEHTMTPEQRQARDERAELERLRKEAAERAEREKQQAEQAEVQQYEAQFDRLFTDVIKRKALPPDADTLMRLASKVEAYWGNGVQIGIDEIADEVSEEIDAQWNRKLSTSDDALFAKLLGKVGLERAQKLLLAQAKKPQPASTPQARTQAPRERRPLSRAEFEARIAKRIGE